MVRLRGEVKAERQQLYDLKLLFQYVRKLVEASAEISFLGKRRQKLIESGRLAFEYEN
jgi:DNA polymerase III sliding clamp (beta) subunit (PCNA family)